MNSDLQLTPKAIEHHLTKDSTKIKWTRDLRNKICSNFVLSPHATDLRTALYRPFTKQFLNATEGMIYLPAIIRRFFPQPDSQNLGIYVPAPGSGSSFTPLITNTVPDLCLLSASGQYFPRYVYREVDFNVLGVDESSHQFERIDNISDRTLAEYRVKYGIDVTKDDIFYYVYGILHSPEYRHYYADDLKRLLPHIPKVAVAKHFWDFSQAGRELADLHVNYETVYPHPLTVEEGIVASNMNEYDYYRVKRMKNIDGHRSEGFTAIQYNEHITIKDIPKEAHNYMLGSRSALGWILDRYQITTHKASGIINDPNDWSKQTQNPRYIFDLIKRVTTVSLKTNQIITSLLNLNWKTPNEAFQE